MEQEALRRAQEMHSYTPRPQKNQRTEVPVTEPPKKALPQSANEEATALNPLFADKEKLLILALILILSSEEKSDPSLTLALLYLIV